jgi:hypothetical protein
VLTLATVRGAVRDVHREGAGAHGAPVDAWAQAKPWATSREGVRVVRDLFEAHGGPAPSLRHMPRSIPAEAKLLVQAVLDRLGKSAPEALGDGLTALLNSNPREPKHFEEEPLWEGAIQVPAGVQVSESDRQDWARKLKAVRGAFRSHVHLLKPYWREQNRLGGIPSIGFCYAGAEAAFHLLGGKGAGWTPRVAKEFNEDTNTWETHWWIERQDGVVVDPTGDQYGGKQPPYSAGKGAGFLTGYDKPSKTTQALLAHAQAALGLP